ncbi:hypothetical protein M409DRAFT_60101 [Zasmidium cellare ATCC 36951]|uniref:NAD-dependent epimerase/dehydratase domain-containing protein n=1 Tax=Zasmidium cellare ATCC 36951 TaxID=1080233 RepID=A0A6A6C1Y9_ZASCE|nr:uncharacterized protein M409DRAFT_60101 [Zasmidium cellare ATCC 36951]KAF2160180.1 hypothetical protein M409DRAFT_60101 [Zasmidium cellare ATCC 36951]
MSPPLVLITGATGHLGFRTLVLLLRTTPYNARITIRKEAQESKIRAAASIQPFLSRIEFAFVPDITAPDAYNSAIKGVRHAIHIASPVPTKPENQTGGWKEIFYDPAVEGTLSILRAAAGENGIKTVVLTASVGVLEVPSGKDRAGPKDYASLPDNYEDLPKDAGSTGKAYRTSKILAFQAAGEFVRKNKVGFALIKVHPGYVTGPHELLESDTEFYTGSNEGAINAALGNLKPYAKPTSQVFLDDAAMAHVLALDPTKVKDGDDLVVMGNGGRSVPWDEVGQVAAGMYPKATEKGLLKPVKGQQTADMNCEVESTEEKLGMRFKGTEDMVRGLVKQYLEFHGHAAE